MQKFKNILNKLKNNKQLMLTICGVFLLLLLCGGVTFAIFNYSNIGDDSNINSGYISMTYTEPSNEYVVENALPMKDGEGVNSANYFEFSVTTTAPTNDADDNGVSIPYEITITESEDNTLTSEQIKMYLTEVEGEKEVVNTSPTLVSNLEDSIYKNEGTKVGFNLHLHRNGNETITTKYRLRAWVDYNVDVSDWDTAGEFVYKFRVNVNGEATYQGYETDQSCFAYEVNANENYSITGYDFSKCDSKNIVVPTSVSEEIVSKEILALNWADDATFIEWYKNMTISDGFCEEYTTETGKEDWTGCLEYNETTEDGFNQEALAMYAGIKSQSNTYIGQNYYDYEKDLSDPIELGILTVDLGEEKTIVNYIKIDEIKSFANTNVTAVSNDKDVYSVNNLNNVVENTEATASTIANETPIINGLIIPEGIEITNDAFSTLEVNQLIDRKGNFPSSCFVYTSASNAITITDYKCQGVKNLRVSSNIDNLPVTTIGNNAFANNQLTSVYIPDNVTTIGYYAFENNKLTTVIIGNGVTTVGNYSFQNNQLASVIIPDSVTTIEGHAFKNNKLTSVIIGNGVTTIGGSAFSNNQLKSVTIPDSVTTIGGSAFLKNQLISVNIPDGVTIIEGFAFSNNQLKSVEIPDSVTYLSGFGGNQLTSVDIPDSVTTIGNSAFARNQLTSVEIPDSVTAMENFAFDKNQLTSVTIPDSVTSIGQNVFSNNKLTSVTIPDSVTTIGTWAFENNSLKYVKMQDNVTLSTDVFKNNKISKIENDSGFTPAPCYKYTVNDTYVELTDFLCPTSTVNIIPTINKLPITTIDESAFANNQLTSVEIPDSVTTIDESAFANNQLTSVEIPDSVTTIGVSAFRNNQLTSVEIPDSVTTIGSSAFSNNQLIKAIIGNGVTIIGGSSFYNNQLTSVTIPDSVTMIGNEAFQNNQLTKAIIGKGVTTIGNRVFYKSSTSNPNLTRIINTTGRSFDWRGIITLYSTGSNSFVTGTVSNVEIVAK